MSLLGITDFLLYTLGLGPDEEVLRKLIHLDFKETPPVLISGGLLKRTFMHMGCPIVLAKENPPSEIPSIICVRNRRRNVDFTLRMWLPLLQKETIFLLISFPSELTPSSICSSLLHLGLQEPRQTRTKALILTSGIFQP